MPLSNPGNDPLQPLANDPTQQRANSGAQSSGLFLPAIAGIPINLRPEDQALLGASMPQEPVQEPAQEPAHNPGPLELRAQAGVLREVSKRVGDWGQHHSLALSAGVMGREAQIGRSVQPIDDWLQGFWLDLEQQGLEPDPSVIEEMTKDGGFLPFRYSSEMLRPMATVQIKRDIAEWAKDNGDETVARLFDQVGERNGVPIYRIPMELGPMLIPAEHIDGKTGERVPTLDSAGRQIFYVGKETALTPRGDSTYLREYGPVVQDDYGFLPVRYADARQYNIFERRALSLLEGNTLAQAIKTTGTEKAWVGFNTYSDMLTMGLFTSGAAERYNRQAGTLGSVGEHRAGLAGDLLSFVTPGGAPSTAFKAGRATGMAALRKFVGSGVKEAGKEAIEAGAKAGFVRGLAASKAGQFAAGASGAVAGGLAWEAARPESGAERAFVDAYAAELIQTTGMSPGQALIEASKDLGTQRMEGAAKMFTMLEFALGPSSRFVGKLFGKVGAARAASKSRAAGAGKELTRESKLLDQLSADKARARWEGLSSGAFLGLSMSAVSPEARASFKRWHDSGYEDEEAWNQVVDAWLIGAGIFAAHGGISHAHAVTRRWRETVQGAGETAKALGKEAEATEAAAREKKAEYDKTKPPGDQPEGPENQAPQADLLDVALREVNLAKKLAKIEEEIVRRAGRINDSAAAIQAMDAEILLVRASSAQRIADALEAASTAVPVETGPAKKPADGEAAAPNESGRIQAARERAAKFHRAVADYVAEVGWDRQIDAIIKAHGGVKELGEQVQYDAELWREIDSLAQQHNERVSEAAKKAARGYQVPRGQAAREAADAAAKEAAEVYDRELASLLGPDYKLSVDLSKQLEVKVKEAAERFGIEYEELRSKLLGGWHLETLSQREAKILREVADRHGIEPDWILDYLTRPEAPVPAEMEVGSRRRIPVGLLPEKGGPITLPEKMPEPKKAGKDALEGKVGEEPGTTADLGKKAVPAEAAAKAHEKPAEAPAKKKVAEPKPKVFEPTGEAPKALEKHGETHEAVDRSVRSKVFQLVEDLPSSHKSAIVEFLNESDRRRTTHQEWAAVRAVEEAQEQGGVAMTTPRSLAKRSRVILDWLERKADTGGREAVLEMYRGTIPKEPPGKVSPEEIKARLRRQAGEAEAKRPVEAKPEPVVEAVAEPVAEAEPPKAEAPPEPEWKRMGWPSEKIARKWNVGRIEEPQAVLRRAQDNLRGAEEDLAREEAEISTLKEEYKAKGEARRVTGDAAYKEAVGYRNRHREAIVRLKQRIEELERDLTPDAPAAPANVSRETSAPKPQATVSGKEYSIDTEMVRPENLQVDKERTFQGERADITDPENLVNPDRELFSRPWDANMYALSPIVAVERPDGGLVVVSGHHRRARALGLHGSPDRPEGEIPVRIVRFNEDVPLERRIEIAKQISTIDNIGGQRLTKVELISRIRSMIGEGKSQKAIAEELGLSTKETRDIVNLSALPDPILDLVRTGVITEPNKMAALGQSVRENPGLWTASTATNFVQALGPKAIADMSAAEWNSTLERMANRFQQKRYNRMEQRLPGLEQSTADIANEVVNYGVERSKEALLLEKQVSAIESLKKSIESTKKSVGEEAASSLNDSMRKLEREAIAKRERIEMLDRGGVLPAEATEQPVEPAGPSLFGEQAKAEWSRATPAEAVLAESVAKESQRFADDHFGLVGYDANGKLVARGLPGEQSLKEFAPNEADLLESSRRHGIHKLLGVYRIGEGGGANLSVEAAGLKATVYDYARKKIEAARATQEATSLFDAPSAAEVDAHVPLRVEFRGGKLTDPERDSFEEAIKKEFNPKVEQAGILGVDKDGNLVAANLWSGTADQVVVDHNRVTDLARSRGITTVLGIYHTHPGGEMPSIADHRAAGHLAEKLAGVPLYVHNGTNLVEVLPATGAVIGEHAMSSIETAEARLKTALESFKALRDEAAAAETEGMRTVALEQAREARVAAQREEMRYYEAMDDAGLGNEANPVTMIRRHKERVTFKRYVSIIGDADPGTTVGKTVLKAPSGKGPGVLRWLLVENGLLKPDPAFLRAAYKARKPHSPTALAGNLRNPRNYISPEMWDTIVREDHQTIRDLDRMQRVLHGRSLDDRMRYGDRKAPDAPLSKVKPNSRESWRVGAALDGWTVGDWNASKEVSTMHGKLVGPDTQKIVDQLTKDERIAYEASDAVLTRFRRRIFEHITSEERAEIERQLAAAQSDVKHYKKVENDLRAARNMPAPLQAAAIAKAQANQLAAQAEVARHTSRIDLMADLRDPDTGQRWGVERYFHRVWEEDGSGKGYENLSPLSRKNMSKEKWIAAVQKREGRSGYLLDVHHMFDVYVPDVIGKVAIDRVLAQGNKYVYGERSTAWGLKDLYRDWHMTRSSMRMDMALIYENPTMGSSAARSRFSTVQNSARYEGDRMVSVRVRDISSQKELTVYSSRADAAKHNDPDAPLARHFLVRRGGLAEALKDPDKALRNIEYVEKLLNRISGRREQSNALDRGMVQLARNITEYEYHAFLGLINPKAAVTNTIFGSTQLIAELGPVWAGKGFAAATKLATTIPGKADAESKRLWKILRTGGSHLESFVGWDDNGLRGMGHPTDAVSQAYVAFKSGSFFLFRNSEKYVRAASYLAGYLAAESKGWSPKECHNFAREVISNTQFDMAAYAAPALTQHPMGFMFVMLRRYALNFLEKHVRGAAGTAHIAHANAVKALGARPGDFASALIKGGKRNLSKEQVEFMEKRAAEAISKRTNVEHIYNTGFLVRSIIGYTVIGWIYEQLTGRDASAQWGSTAHDIPILSSVAARFEDTTLGSAVSNMQVPGLTGPFDLFTPATQVPTTLIVAGAQAAAGDTYGAKETFWKKPELWMGRTPYALVKASRSHPDPFNEGRITYTKPGSTRTTESTTTWALWGDFFLPGTKESTKAQFKAQRDLAFESNKRASLRQEINDDLGSGEQKRMLEGLKKAADNGILVDPNELDDKFLNRAMTAAVRGAFSQPDKEMKVKYAARQLKNLTKGEAALMLHLIGFDGSGDWHRDSKGNRLVSDETLKEFYAALAEYTQAGQ